MRKNVIDYKILSGKNVSDLESQVRSHVQQKEGWMPSGSLVLKGDEMYQPIMRVQKD